MGGNTTTCQTGRNFFGNQELRNRLLTVLPEEKRANMESTMQNIAVILRYIWQELQKNLRKDYAKFLTITEKAPTRAFLWLKAPVSTFTFKTLLRHYAKQALTPH